MPPPSLYGRRLRAIPTPCPSCIPFSPRVASIIATGLIMGIYLAWSIFLWSGYTQLNEVKELASGSALAELTLMSRFANFAGFFAATMATVSFGSLVVSCFPQRDFAKWLSRTIWIGWLVTWALGIFGTVVYVSSDAFLAAGCSKGDECWSFRQRLQIWLIVCLFLTLILVFWFGVILSAFVHTLHPHLFLSPDSDSEDEYSDYEAEKEKQLAAELRASNHPYAADALAYRALQRSQARAAMAGYGGSSSSAMLRQRSASRRRQEFSDDEGIPPARVALSTGKRRSRGGEQEMSEHSIGKGTRCVTKAQQYSDDSDESGSEGSDEAELEKGLMAGDGASSSSARRRGRPSRRELSAIESVGDSAEDSDQEEEHLPPPPSYRSMSRGRGRSESLQGGMGAVSDEEEQVGRSRSRGRY
ncbi:hypothetical protein JCM11251_007264 [Rhodosporidiobolus azoricus]